MRERQILHLDMDTFFVSVERLHDSSLRGVAVVVGSDNPLGRGVVSAASYEARAFGVHSAMPLRRAYRLCPKARFINPTPGVYGEASRAIRDLCHNVAPLVEMGSMEEAYLDLTGTELLYPNAGAVADLLESRIMKELELPSSFGWGENKLLAKVASGRSKPRGLLRVFPGHGRTFLAPLPIRRLPGVGPKNAELLGRYGLRWVGDLDRLGERRLYEALGEPGRALYHRAHGEDDSPVLPRRTAQSIGREHTFETDTGHRPTLLSKISYLSERLAAALRKDGWLAWRITLKVRYSDYKSATRTTALPVPTDDDRTIYRAAAAALEGACRRRVRLRLVGVAAHDITREPWTLDLFEGERVERLERLNRVFDGLRERYGFGALLRGSSWEGAGRGGTRVT